MVCSARGKHELGSALFATAGALFFGLGFGRVLQRVHARARPLPLPKRGVAARRSTRRSCSGCTGSCWSLSSSRVGFALAVGWIGCSFGSEQPARQAAGLCCDRRAALAGPETAPNGLEFTSSLQPARDPATIGRARPAVDVRIVLTSEA